MSSQSFQGDSIGPQLDLADFRIPPHLGARLSELFDTEERISTGAEWVATNREAANEAMGQLPTKEDLCYFEDGKHTIEIEGETDSFVCVLDPIALAFLEGTPATVRSVTPEDETEVTIDIEPDGATADPDDAVVSLGVARDLSIDGPASPEDIYQESCPYIHVFADADEYERWADGVDASTTSMPVDVGLAVAREVAFNLFETED